MDQTSLANFDLWRTVEASQPAGLAFGLETAPQAISRWRLDLPAGPSAASDHLATLETRQRAAAMVLAAAPQRLERLLAQPQPAISFSGSAPAKPEADLLLVIADLRAPTSFAPDQPAPLAQVGAQFQAGLARLFQLLTHLAWVETRRDGLLLGQTLVGWSGDTRTLWGDSLKETEQALHRHNLRLALAGRLLHLRLLIIATQAAAKISLLLGSTGGAGALLALPLAWRYANQILQELDRFQELSQDPRGF